MLKIVPVYASLLALLFLGLSVRTILLRGKFKVGIGSGGRLELERAMRVQIQQTSP